MKKIYLTILFICTPVLSFGQSIDLSVIENFDVQAATSCDPASPACQKQIADLQALIVVLLQQIVALNLADNTDVDTQSSSTPYYEESEYVNEYKKTPNLSSSREKSFSVRDGEVSISDEEHAYYREIVRLLKIIVPDYIFDDFEKITFIDSSREYYAAQIRQSIQSRNGKKTEQWQLYVNMDDITLDNSTKYNRSLETLVHETGHALLTNERQLDFFTDRGDCQNLYVAGLRSCAKDNSYYETLSPFWSDDFIDWTDDYQKLFEKSRSQAERELEDYYAENKDQFVSEYAATAIHEDAAETIAHYAIESFPTGLLTPAEEKIVSLFDFAEMRTLRKTVQGLLQ